jgi:hypothetical protein
VAERKPKKTLLYGPKGEPLIREREFPKPAPGRFDRTTGIARPTQYQQIRTVNSKRDRQRARRRQIRIAVEFGFLGAVALLVAVILIAGHA